MLGGGLAGLADADNSHADRICVLCGWSGSRFAPYGENNRPDAQCPACDAKERHRLLWLYLLRELPVADRERMLCCSPVEGIRRRLASVGPARTLSSDPEYADVDTRADLTRLPFKDGSFDAILCSHVLEHISNERAALAELRRVLRDDGWCLILVPQNRALDTTYEDETITTSRGRKRAFGQSNHVRVYGSDVADRLEAVGFEVQVSDYSSKLADGLIERYGLTEADQWLHDRSLIFHCRLDQ